MSTQQRARRLSRVEISGAEIQTRRQALHLSPGGLAKEAGVDRSRVVKFEADDEALRDATKQAILDALDRLEAQRAGLPEGVRPIGNPSEGLVEINMKGVYGVESIIVKGPVADVDALRQTARDLIRGIREDSHPDDEISPDS